MIPDSDMNILKISAAVLILFYASILDWKYREIDDRSWLSMVVLGIIFTGYDYVRFDQFFIIKIFAISFLISLVLAFALYYTGLMGGGDGKILMGIGAMFPFYPYAGVFSILPLFVLSVFANAILLSAVMPVIFFIYNLKSIKEIKSVKDFFIMFLGYKKKASAVNDHEVIIKDGEDCWIFLNAKNIELGKKGDGDKEVWVTPALPFVIPIMVGFFISLIYGDILSYLVVGLL
jgi:archaeal preflagellin peptidase FlaK